MFILALCTGALLYVLIAGDRAIQRIDNQVSHTYAVISNAREVSALIEGMLAAQRGYIVTRDEKFMDNYRRRRDRVSELIVNLSKLTNDNKSQTIRLDEIRHHFNAFSVKLEQRAQNFTITRSAKIIMNDLEEIDGLKETILKVNNEVLREEYGILDQYVHKIEVQKSNYFITLMIGICTTALALLVFNFFLLSAQRKKTYIEASLKDTEERFALAIEGTQDGIFDWDIQTGKVFYSKQFFAMLGDMRGACNGTTADVQELIHPEDAPRVQDYLSKYLSGELLEYSQEFRMRHKNGEWISIQSRAKGIFDRNQRVVRMVGAHTDISHLKDSQARLEAEKKAAEDANQAKRDFLAHMSHEIRTPLTAISGIAEILEGRPGNLDAKQKKLVQTLSTSTAVLKDLINDILDFSKIEGGELELEVTTFNLGKLFDEVVSMMSVRANQKGISFVFDYTDVKDLNFRGDKTRLRQILVNLTSNAVKFTSVGGVSLRAYIAPRNGQDMLHIDFSDTGIGIAPDHLDMIFERFKQADSSVSRKYGGTGLGLSISRNLAEMMGGNIIVQSEVDKGSTFTLYLPLDHQPAAAEPQEKSPGQKPPDAGNVVPLSESRKVLMVEDYEGNVVVFSHVLDELGYSYDVAGTGLQAIAKWEQGQYDLILMDIQMPEMDGLAATREIRSAEAAAGRAKTPIIGMTAHALVGDRDRCLQAGMDDYLTKPIVEAEFRRLVLKYAGFRKASDAA